MISLLRVVLRRVVASKASQWRWLARTMLAVSVWRWLTRRRAGAGVVTLRSDEVMQIDIHKRTVSRR